MNTAKYRDSQSSSRKKARGFLRVFWDAGCQKFTVMLVPHTERKTLHFKISFFTLISLVIFFLVLLTGFFWFFLDFFNREALLLSRSRDLAKTEASLDIIRDEVGELVSSADAFRESLKKTMDVLGLQNVNPRAGSTENGDLSSLFVVERVEGNTLPEVADLQSLRISMDDSVTPLKDIGVVLSSQKALLSDIPTIWPLKGTRGVITQVFGPAIHPFYRYWYLHRGIDIGARSGVPVVATADGKVTERKLDRNGFGYFIVIQHKYGFKTRYAHLQRQLVEVGQQVSQGETIGTVGSTGQSTGPHLHYEATIGTQLVDPVKFLNMTNSEGSQRRIVTSLRRYQ